MAVPGLILLVGAVLFGVNSWRLGQELELARRDIGRQAWGAALQRLEAIERSRPGYGDGEVPFWIGMCNRNLGRHSAAMAAFWRVPSGSRYDERAAAFQAEDLVMRWQFRAAEDRLLRAMKPGSRGAGALREILIRIGRMEARFDEVRAWLRESLSEAGDPVVVLQQLWLLDRGVSPTDGIRENLERALATSPDDDRVWLGLGRVAVLEGELDEGARWLRRCRERSPDDLAVARAWLDWAFAAGDADEAARTFGGRLWSALDPMERLTGLARLARLRGDAEGERRALELIDAAAPHQAVVLERLGTLAAEAGDAGRAAELRRRKARVDAALDRYPRVMATHARTASVADRLMLARLAEEAGRPFEAQAWCRLAAQLDPGASEPLAILTRLERGEARMREAAAGIAPPSIGPPSLQANRERHQPVGARVAFRDEAEAVGLRFTFLTGETVIHQLPETMGGGLALLDYDGDGWLDVYCTQGGTFPPRSGSPSPGDRLFRNRGDGTFEDVTESAGIPGATRGYGHGVAVGDYDNDGHPDLFVTRWRSYALYRNRGDGTFEDVTVAAGLGGDRDWPTSAAFADLDGDGDLDLYVCHYLEWDAEHPKLCRDSETQGYVTCSPRDFAALPDHVFRNDGGRFVDVTESAGIVDEDGRGLGVVAADLDADGRIDLFVANDQTANFCFRNLGGFRFEEAGHAAGLASNAGGGYQAGMGVACGDLDGDGRPELAVTNFYGECTTLYQNLGGGLFSDRTAACGLAMPSRYLLGFGASFLDADNDGQLDLITANGHLDRLPGTPYEMPVQLLLGDGKMLREVAAAGGPALTVPRIGRALATGDLDNDGRIDALVLDHVGPLAYLHNETPRRDHFLTLRLESLRSNRDAVGARVVVLAGGRRQFGWRLGGGSYQSASDGRLHFGLGSAERVDEVEVTWPSGSVQRFASLPADRGYLIREGQDVPEPLPGFP